MPATRRKAVAQTAPQTIEEATALLGRYAGILTSVEQLRADADASIATIEAARDAFIAPLEEEAKGLFLQLRAWWAVAGETLTEGKRKSHELAGCVLGERITPPSLSTGKMKVPDAIAAIFRLAVELLRNRPLADRLKKLVRIKHELDKPAILKELGSADLGPKLTGLGFAPKQKAEFFIDRAAPKPETPEVVADPVAQDLAA